MNKLTSMGYVRINQLIQARLHSPDESYNTYAMDDTVVRLYKHDPIICYSTFSAPGPQDHSKIVITTGRRGIVRATCTQSRKVTIFFEHGTTVTFHEEDPCLANLHPAYAITAQKLPGYQYRNMILCMDAVQPDIHTAGLLRVILSRFCRSLLILSTYETMMEYSKLCFNAAGPSCVYKESMVQDMLNSGPI